MKKMIVFLFLSFVSQFIFGQKCTSKFLGTKTLYQQQQKVYSPVPKGYSPVFINYAGRHGARHLTKDVNTSFAYSLLMKADSANALNSDGQRLKKMILLLEKIEKKNFKSISQEGKEELQGIATRMIENNRGIFLNHPLFKITITKELRTKQTAEAFLTGLNNKVENAEMPVNDTTLRFYDFSPAYIEYEENGTWLRELQGLKKKLHYTEESKKIVRSFFEPNFLKLLTTKELENFTSDIFGFYTIIFSIQNEINAANIPLKELDFGSFFTCNQLEIFNKIDEAEDFFLKGPAFNNSGIQVKIAAPLLMDFVNSTNDYLQFKKENVQLRFTHAEAIAPLAALMGITNASVATKYPDKINSVWKAGDIIPLSANIQWIIYSKKNSTDYLVKFLLNEKEVRITGLNSDIFPYYHWSQVQKFYLAKLQRFNLKPGDNFYQFLLNVK